MFSYMVSKSRPASTRSIPGNDPSHGSAKWTPHPPAPVCCDSWNCRCSEETTSAAELAHRAIGHQLLYPGAGGMKRAADDDEKRDPDIFVGVAPGEKVRDATGLCALAREATEDEPVTHWELTKRLAGVTKAEAAYEGILLGLRGVTDGSYKKGVHARVWVSHLQVWKQVSAGQPCDSQLLRPRLEKVRSMVSNLKKRGIQVSVLHSARAGQGMTAAESSATLVAGGSYAARGCTAEKQAPTTQPGIKGLLERWGMRWEECGGKGDCLFRSVAWSAESSPNGHAGFRKLAVGVMRKDAAFYSPFIEGEAGAEGYLAAMAQLGTWGDHLCLHAIARAMRTRVVVMDVGPGNVLRATVIDGQTDGALKEGSAEKANLAFRESDIVLAYEGGVHYGAVTSAGLQAGEEIMCAVGQPQLHVPGTAVTGRKKAPSVRTDAEAPLNLVLDSPGWKIPVWEAVPDIVEGVTQVAAVAWSGELVQGLELLHTLPQVVLVSRAKCTGATRTRKVKVAVRTDRGARMEEVWLGTMTSDLDKVVKPVEESTAFTSKLVTLMGRTLIRAGEGRTKGEQRMRRWYGLQGVRCGRGLEKGGWMEMSVDVTEDMVCAMLKRSGREGVFVRHLFQAKEYGDCGLLWKAEPLESALARLDLAEENLEDSVRGLAVGEGGYAVRVMKGDLEAAKRLLVQEDVVVQGHRYEIGGIPANTSVQLLCEGLAREAIWTVKVLSRGHKWTVTSDVPCPSTEGVLEVGGLVLTVCAVKEGRRVQKVGANPWGIPLAQFPVPRQGAAESGAGTWAAKARGYAPPAARPHPATGAPAAPAPPAASSAAQEEIELMKKEMKELREMMKGVMEQQKEMLEAQKRMMGQPQQSAPVEQPPQPLGMEQLRADCAEMKETMQQCKEQNVQLAAESKRLTEENEALKKAAREAKDKARNAQDRRADGGEEKKDTTTDENSRPRDTDQRREGGSY